MLGRKETLGCQPQHTGGESIPCTFRTLPRDQISCSDPTVPDNDRHDDAALAPRFPDFPIIVLMIVADDMRSSADAGLLRVINTTKSIEEDRSIIAYVLLKNKQPYSAGNGLTTCLIIFQCKLTWVRFKDLLR